MPADISSTELKEILESRLVGIGDLRVDRGGNCYGYNWEIEWISHGGNKNEIMATNHLQGLDVQINVETLREGGIIFGPLTGEFLQVAMETPQVRKLTFCITSFYIEYRKYEKV